MSPCFRGGFGQRASPTPNTGGGGDVFIDLTNDFASPTIISNNDFGGKPAVGVPYQGWVLRDATDGTLDDDILVPNTDLLSPMAPGFSDHKYAKGKFPSTLIPGDSSYSIARYFNSVEKNNQIYCSFAHKHISPWENDVGGAGVKFIWIHTLTDGDYDTSCYCGIDGTNLTFTFHQQGDPSAGNRDFDCNLGTLAQQQFLSRIDSWVKWQFRFKMNTVSGTANGTLEVWADGVKIMNYTDVNWGGQADRKFTGLRWERTYGGAGSPPSQDQFDAMSHFYISHP